MQSSLKTGFIVFSSCRRRGTGGNQRSPKSLYLCVEIHPYRPGILFWTSA
nr:MAG TPA: hypothetical protein [Caudoviricetes sp.]